MVTFDVVTVPDFRGPAAARFELLTLMFLASWIERVDARARPPLHLACIGEPPPRVQALAARAGAEISVHEPIGSELSVTANKLRGLEVPSRGEQRLLLDTDTLVVGGLSGLADLGCCLAAAPAVWPRVAPESWELVYEAAGQSMPNERIACQLHAVGVPGADRLFAGQAAEYAAMPPYYNSGVVWVPTGKDLRDRWGRHLRTVARVFPQDHPMRHSDQVAFAMAVEELRRAGVPWRILPLSWNASWVTLYARRPPWRRTGIFHAMGLFRPSAYTVDQSMREGLIEYREHLRYRVTDLAAQLSARERRSVMLRRWLGWRRDLRAFGAYLERLHARYIARL